jgi:hypothetical protein
MPRLPSRAAASIARVRSEIKSGEIAFAGGRFSRSSRTFSWSLMKIVETVCLPNSLFRLAWHRLKNREYRSLRIRRQHPKAAYVFTVMGSM